MSDKNVKESDHTPAVQCFLDVVAAIMPELPREAQDKINASLDKHFPAKKDPAPAEKKVPAPVEGA